MLKKAFVIEGLDQVRGAMQVAHGLSSDIYIVVKHWYGNQPMFHAFQNNQLTRLLEGADNEKTLAAVLDLNSLEPAITVSLPDLGFKRTTEIPVVVLDGDAVVGVLSLHLENAQSLKTGRLYTETLRTNGIKELRDPDSVPDDTGKPAYVNYDFYDISLPPSRLIEISEGFRGGHTYRLSVAITYQPDQRFDGQVQPPVEYPDGQTVELLAAVFVRRGPLKIAGNKPLDLLKLQEGKTIQPAEFILETENVSQAIQGVVEAYIYYQTNLIYTARFRIEVAPEDHRWSSTDRPIYWDYQDDDDSCRSMLFRRLSALGHLSQRALNLVIQKGDKPDTYQLTALLGRAELPAQVTLNRLELDDYIMRVRRLLDNLRREPIYIEGGYNESGEYTGDFTGDSGGYDCHSQRMPGPESQKIFCKFLSDIAILGSQLYDRLFASESGRILRSALEMHLQKEDIIQIWIDKDAASFIFPWTWLYRESVDSSHRFTPKLDLFWGYNFMIEQLVNFEETQWREPPPSKINENLLRIKIGTFNFEPETQVQNQYFHNTSLRSEGRIECSMWDDDRSWENFLPHCDSHVLYFFSHGHTAKPTGLAGQPFYDMIAAWKQWLSEPVGDEDSAIESHKKRGAVLMQDLESNRDLLDESFIRLRRGALLQRELQYKMDLSKANPIVFLNMCESAQVFPSLSDSLIDVFLKKGARAVIGTEMPMLCGFADLWAREVFEALLFQKEPETVGKILFKLRRKYLEMGNPLGLAYTLFGDAMVSIIPG